MLCAKHSRSATECIPARQTLCHKSSNPLSDNARAEYRTSNETYKGSFIQVMRQHENTDQIRRDRNNVVD
eukprot:6134488-Amphidinium_carterae.2